MAVGSERNCACLCGCGGIDACLSVCMVHLAHDWNWIHLEGRGVLNLTDNAFHIVKNHKQTVRAGNYSYNSAILKGDRGSRKAEWISHTITQTSLTQTSHSLWSEHCKSLYWFNSTAYSATYILHAATPVWQEPSDYVDTQTQFSPVCFFFTPLTLKTKKFKVLAFLLHLKEDISYSSQVVPFQRTFPKQMFFGRKDEVYASTHNEISHQQNRLDALRLQRPQRKDEQVKSKMFFYINTLLSKQRCTVIPKVSAKMSEI